MNPPITKKEFVDIMNSVENYWHCVEGIEDILKVNLEEGPFLNIVDVTLNTLCSLMKDEPSQQDDWNYTPYIYQFAWDCDFGKKSDSLCVVNQYYPFETPEDLYDLLIELYWREEN